jgi:acyl transferase domain-containing protein
VHKSPVTPIAVIGMACRLPGGIDSPEQLWEALLRGDDLVTEIPPDRWDADEYYDPEPGVPGRSVSKWGAFLDDVAWTHRRLLLSRNGQESPTQGGCTVSVHPLLGPRVRLPEEPERHVSEAEVGTGARPWLADHGIRNVAVLPAAAYCVMALAAARAVLGEASAVRDIRFEQALLLDEQTTVGAVASVEAPGVVNFTLETNQQGEPVRRTTAVLHAAQDDQPPAQDMPALLAGHPRRQDGAEVRKRLDGRGVQYGPAFTGLAAVRTGEGEAGTVLADRSRHQNAVGPHEQTRIATRPPGLAAVFWCYLVALETFGRA